MKKISLLLIFTLIFTSFSGFSTVFASPTSESIESYIMDLEVFQNGDFTQMKEIAIELGKVKERDNNLKIILSDDNNEMVIEGLPRYMNDSQNILYFETYSQIEDFEIMCLTIEKYSDDVSSISVKNKLSKSDSFIKLILRNKSTNELVVTEISNLGKLDITDFKVDVENAELKDWYARILEPEISEEKAEVPLLASRASSGYTIDYGSTYHIYSYYVMGNKINHYIKVNRAYYYPISTSSAVTDFKTEIRVAEKKTISTDLPSYNSSNSSCLTLFSPTMKSSINGGGFYLESLWSGGYAESGSSFNFSVLWNYVPYVNDIVSITNSYTNSSTKNLNEAFDLFSQLGSGYVKQAQSRITEELSNTQHYYISKWVLNKQAYSTGNVTVSTRFEYMVNVDLNPSDNYNVSKTTTKVITVY